MEHLKRGEYFCNEKQVFDFNNLIITETKFRNSVVDWHYHENPYFSYSLEGYCLEKNKKQSYPVQSGTLLFHNWQDVHCNTNHSAYSRNFYIELEKEWLKKYDIEDNIMEGSNQIDNPFLKALYHQIYIETKLKDNTFQIATESLLLNIFSVLKEVNIAKFSIEPLWVNKVKEIIHDQFAEKITLQYLSKQTNIHPAHISRDFPKYFDTTLGNYIRKVKIEHSVTLLIKSESLTNIAYQCGFSDQSHFIRCFKSTYNMTPNKFKSILASR
ncbi:helix-turn-helix domain-containing protein [Pontimicrobium aquaticum]|uniref:Helix-turn-helix domain-containing protein n=1 Tax=Pontimicrobium aquaticum TaxID=2565367 RepID=A0A4U0F0W7_9FLAO|nr:response regulator transcription factor [Pontimicrobium aquaticum]TJY38047.1 helix-turn-helix domain-containing protein [Pontimicrobium aquaticum]